MIKQAVNYLRGAVSSVVLVGVAVVAAALIMVSVGTGHSPLGILGLDGPQTDPPVVTVDQGERSFTRVRDARRTRAPATAATGRTAGRGAVSPAPQRPRRPTGNRPGRDSPATEQPVRSGIGGGQDRRSERGPAAARRPHPQQPTSDRQSPPRAGSSGGGSNGGGPARPAPDDRIGEKPGSGGDSGAGAGGTPISVSQGLNETVDGLDNTLGGTLDKTGLGDTVKQVTEGLVGPDTGLGKTVDGVSRGLGKLLRRR